MRNIEYIVLHYSATYPDLNFDVVDMRRMHKARGFKDVGYHYVLPLNGVVQAGRPEDEVGAHVKGYNKNSIGICLIGGLSRESGEDTGVDTRTEEQKQGAADLIYQLLQKYPGAKVVGHMDLASTQCPAYDVGAWWSKEGLRLAQRGSTRPVARPDVPEWLKTLYGRLRSNLRGS